MNNAQSLPVKIINWVVTRIVFLQLSLLQKMGLFHNLYSYLNSKGILLITKHYYIPIPDIRDIKRMKKSEMVGIVIDSNRCKQFFTSITQYADEYHKFPLTGPRMDGEFYVLNGSFMSCDSLVYYGLLRHIKPRNIIEIGTGFSTLVSIAAKEKNKESMFQTRITCIDPYPKKFVYKNPEINKIIQKKVQHVPLSVFLDLNRNDVLFIDSTHTVTQGGDVWWLLCEVLPRLQSGVFIHVHDVELPHHYPREYYDKHWYFSEQYILQCLLAHTTRYEILWPASWMLEYHRRFVLQTCYDEYHQEKKKYHYARPSSLWLRVK